MEESLEITDKVRERLKVMYFKKRKTPSAGIKDDLISYIIIMPILIMFGFMVEFEIHHMICCVIILAVAQIIVLVENWRHIEDRDYRREIRSRMGDENYTRFVRRVDYAMAVNDNSVHYFEFRYEGIRIVDKKEKVRSAVYLPVIYNDDLLRMLRYIFSLGINKEQLKKIIDEESSMYSCEIRINEQPE